MKFVVGSVNLETQSPWEEFGKKVFPEKRKLLIDVTRFKKKVARSTLKGGSRSRQGCNLQFEMSRRETIHNKKSRPCRGSRGGGTL